MRRRPPPQTTSSRDGEGGKEGDGGYQVVRRFLVLATQLLDRSGVTLGHFSIYRRPRKIVLRWQRRRMLVLVMLLVLVVLLVLLLLLLLPGRRVGARSVSDRRCAGLACETALLAVALRAAIVTGLCVAAVLNCGQESRGECSALFRSAAAPVPVRSAE